MLGYCSWVLQYILRKLLTAQELTVKDRLLGLCIASYYLQLAEDHPGSRREAAPEIQRHGPGTEHRSEIQTGYQNPTPGIPRIHHDI